MLPSVASDWNTASKFNEPVMLIELELDVVAGDNRRRGPELMNG